MTDTDLDDVFNDSTVKEPVAEANEPEPEDETGDTPDGEAEPPAAKEPDKAETVPLAALTDERRKRKALEDELAKYKAEPEAKAEKPKRPDVFEDPEGAFDYVENSVSKATWKVRVELSQDNMRDKHDDYDDMEKVFVDLASKNPDLTSDNAYLTNPAKFAYKTAKAYVDNKKLLNPETAKQEREKMKEQIRKELLEELEQEESPTAKRKLAALSVPNLNRATSVKRGSDNGEDDNNVFKGAHF